MRSFSWSSVAASAVALLFTSIIGCGDDAPGRPSEAADELFEQGPYEVGYREIAMNYGAAASGESRELVLRVWYPAQDDSGASPVVYQLAGVINLVSEHALDAPPVTDDTDLPFVIYSHGSGGEGLLGYPFGELMASHGWVLVSPNHTGNTAFDALVDTSDPTTRIALDRPNDITAIIDEFESGLSGDELEGKADTSAAFVFGHSFGGYTTFASGGTAVDYDTLNANCDTETNESCGVLADPEVEAAYRAGFLDERIVAIAPQAPALIAMSENALAALEIPTMLMSGRLDQTTTQEESAEPAWAGIDHPDDLWVEMPKGAHNSFITICHDLSPDLLEVFQPGAGADGCGPDFIDTREAIPVLGAYVLGFGRLHVLGEMKWGPILKGPPLGNPGAFLVMTK